MRSIFKSAHKQEKPTKSPDCGCDKVPKFLEGIKFKECMYGATPAREGNPREIALAYAKFSLVLVLLVLCSIYALSGLFYIATGILLLFKKDFKVTSREISAKAILFIGCIVLQASLVGFFGAKKLCIKWLLIFVATFTILLPIGIIITARADYVFQVKDEQELKKSLKNYTSNPQFWDDIQEQFDCCGINGPEDWDKTIPQTCCRSSFEKLQGEKASPKCNGGNKYLNEKGCLGAVQRITSNIKIILKVALGLAFFKVAPILVGVVLLILMDFDR